MFTLPLVRFKMLKAEILPKSFQGLNLVTSSVHEFRLKSVFRLLSKGLHNKVRYNNIGYFSILMIRLKEKAISFCRGMRSSFGSLNFTMRSGLNVPSDQNLADSKNVEQLNTVSKTLLHKSAVFCMPCLTASKVSHFVPVVITLLFIAMITGCAKAAKVEKPQPVAVQQDPFIYHQVKYPGETLALIANWYTGNPENWKAITKVNPGLKANLIKIGDVIKIPRELVIKTEPLPKPRSQGSVKQAPRQKSPTRDESSTSAQGVDQSASAPSSAQDSGGKTGAGANTQQRAQGSKDMPKGEQPAQNQPSLRKTESASQANQLQQNNAPTESRFNRDEERERIRKELLRELLQ